MGKRSLCAAAVPYIRLYSARLQVPLLLLLLLLAAPIIPLPLLLRLSSWYRIRESLFRHGQHGGYDAGTGSGCLYKHMVSHLPISHLRLSRLGPIVARISAPAGCVAHAASPPINHSNGVHVSVDLLQKVAYDNLNYHYASGWVRQAFFQEEGARYKVTTHICPFRVELRPCGRGRGGGGCFSSPSSTYPLLFLLSRLIHCNLLALAFRFLSASPLDETAGRESKRGRAGWGGQGPEAMLQLLLFPELRCIYHCFSLYHGASRI